MVDVDGLSDAELRSKLQEFGFPVMPITGTTRKIMAKKLKILLENKAKTTNESRHSLGKYSSEEESDTDIRPTKPRRITMAAPVSKVSTRRMEPDRENEPTPSKVIEEKKVTTKTTTFVRKLENDYDTGSDTETEVIESTVNNHEHQSSQPSILPTSSFLNLKRSQQSPENSFSSPGRYTSYTGGASDYAADRLNQIRSRLSLNTTNYNKPYGSTINSSANEDKVDTPFLSNFTKRLSQLSNQKVDVEPKKESVLENNDTNGSSFTPKYMSRPVKRDFVRDYHQTGKRSHLKNNLVSFAVIALAILFFVGLAILYMGMRDGQTGVDVASDLHITYCVPKNPNHVRGKNCIADTDLRDAVDLYTALKPELTRVAVEHKCSGPNKGYLAETDVFKFVKKYLPEMYNLELVLSNLRILALVNPKWEVSLIRDEGGKTILENPIEDIDELVKLIEDGNKVVLAILNPDIPWKCTIYNKLSAIFNITIICLGLFVVLYLTNTGYKYLKHFRQKQKDELYYLVERIVDTLQGNASEDGENFLVINHVRDMIIPINDRSRMEKVWKKAVKFINDNESRVRTEMQVVQGEPYEVWRWLGNPNMNTSGVKNKSWQGQAFETQVGSVNSLPCSPTPCLKVRGMVDDGDRNLHTIREAVLSKCAHQCRILHCAVDTTSQCVYIKCANQEDAAIAYRSLHGWWFAGNLVTVKYLRLERYMQRYPDSPVSGPPYLKALQPGTEWVS